MPEMLNLIWCVFDIYMKNHGIYHVVQKDYYEILSWQRLYMIQQQMFVKMMYHINNRKSFSDETKIHFHTMMKSSN